MAIVKVIPFFKWFGLSQEDRSLMLYELAERNRYHSGRIEVRRETFFEFLSRKSYHHD